MSTETSPEGRIRRGNEMQKNYRFRKKREGISTLSNQKRGLYASRRRFFKPNGRFLLV